MIMFISTEMMLVICTVPLNDSIAFVTVCVSVRAMSKRHNSTKFDRTLVVTAYAKSVSCTKQTTQYYLGELLVNALVTRPFVC